MTQSQRILDFLNFLGPGHEGAPVWQIAHATRLPTGVVRTTLTALETQRLVVSSWQPRGCGRPAECVHWITDAGREHLMSNAGVTP